MTEGSSGLAAQVHWNSSRTTTSFPAVDPSPAETASCRACFQSVGATAASTGLANAAAAASRSCRR